MEGMKKYWIKYIQTEKNYYITNKFTKTNQNF